jgi:hypothetical protein
MPFDSREYEWPDITIVIGNRDITGIRSIKYKEKMEAEAMYAKGRNPQSIQTGNISYEGEIAVTQSEYEALVKAGNGSVLKLRNLTAVIGYGNPSNGDAMITDTLKGIQFTEGGKEFKQGDKFTEITLPFLATRLINQVQ